MFLLRTLIMSPLLKPVCFSSVAIGLLRVRVLPADACMRTALESSIHLPLLAVSVVQPVRKSAAVQAHVNIFSYFIVAFTLSCFCCYFVPRVLPEPVSSVQETAEMLPFWAVTTSFPIFSFRVYLFPVFRVMASGEVHT